jgi:hypothetical protein
MNSLDHNLQIAMEPFPFAKIVLLGLGQIKLNGWLYIKRHA